MKKLVLIWIVAFLAVPFFSYTQNIEEYIEFKKQLQEELLGTNENITTEEEAVFSLKSRGANDFGAAPAPVWANHFGGSTSDYTYGVTTDNSGNIYITGTFSGKITIGGNEYNSVGTYDAYVAKLNNTGTVVWITQIPATAGNTVYSNDIVVDATGNSYITGYYTGSIRLNTTELPDINNFTFFYAKLDDSGNIVNGAYHSQDENERGLFIDIDNSGNIYTTVSKSTSTDSRHESWILKYDANATLLWEKSFDESFNSIIVYGDNLFFSGVMNSYNDGFIDDNLTLPMPISHQDIFIAKADLNGNFIWGYIANHNDPFSGDSYEGYIDSDRNGNFFLTGFNRGSISFNENSLSGDGDFIGKFDEYGTFSWLYRISTSGTSKISVDGSGNCYVAKNLQIFKLNTSGELQWSAPITKYAREIEVSSTGKIVEVGTINGLAYTSQFDNAGVEEWTTQIDGDYGFGRTLGMDADNTGNVYTYGTTAPTNYFGQEIGKGSFICKQDASGNVVWLNHFPDVTVTTSTSGNPIIIDKQNQHVYICGYFEEPLVINGTTTLTPAPEGSTFVIKYDVDGNYINHIQEDFVGGGALSVESDYTGNLILSDSYDQTVNVANTDLTSSGQNDVYLAKYDSNLSPLWVLNVGGESTEWMLMASTDAADNIYVTGEFYSQNINIGSHPLTMNEGDGNTCLAKINASGNIVWAKTLAAGGTGSSDYSSWPTGIVSNELGETYIKGWHGKSTFFDDIEITNPNSVSDSYNYYITKLDANGNVLWANSINEETYGFDYNQFAIDASGSVYLGAQAKGELTFNDSYTYTPSSGYDLFVAKYRTDGVLDWVKTIQSMDSYNTWISSVAVYNNEIYVGGYFDAYLNIDGQELKTGIRHGFVTKLQNQVYNVTFNVDMANASNFDPINDNVYLSGTMYNWGEPGSTSVSQAMSRVDETMVWTITLPLTEGSYSYKYYINEGIEGIEWEGDPKREIEFTTDITTNDIWASAKPALFAGGSGIESNPYLVSNAEQLNNVRLFLDAYYLQTADINLGVAPWNEGEGWEPIGIDYNNDFTGTFNGADYTISNLTINRPAVNYQGLFGSAENAIIENIRLVDVNIVGAARTGAIVGQASNSYIEKCLSAGTISGTNYVGGLVGFNTYGNINQCFSSVNVTGAYYIGGITGVHQGNNMLLNSYSTGILTGGENVGGLAGTTAVNSLIENSYFAGTISGTSGLGGLVAYRFSVSTVHNSFWDTQTSGVTTSEVGGEGKTTAEMKDIYTYTSAGWDFKGLGSEGVWNIDPDGYPYLSWINPTNDGPDAPVVANIIANEVTNITGAGATINATITCVGYPTATQYGVCWNTTGEPTTTDSKTTLGPISEAGSFNSSITGLTPNTVYYVRAYAENAQGIAYSNELTFITVVAPAGDGSPETPYQISSLAELYWLATTPSVWGMNFIQTNDIDASQTANWNNGEGFLPIGNGENPFTGLYNGNGHLISNITINLPDNDSVGVFGKLQDATLEKVGIINANIVGSSYVGALAGGISFSIIEQCFTSGNVEGKGGNDGGLVGVSEQGEVRSCYSTCSITGYVGSPGQGGLIGFVNETSIRGCYSMGLVTSPYANGLIGNINGGEVENCYWDTETSGCLSSIAGTGKTTAEMIDITTFLNGGWDFKGLGVEGVWNIGNERNNGYPYLSWQYPEDPAISMEILPSAIITSVTEITQNSANINIEVTNLGIPQGISFGICWSNINPEPTTSDNSQVSAEPFALGSFIQNINGLTHSATYYARAFASNTNGTAYSDVFVFTTECGPITTPFNENFDNSSELPFCWNTIVVNGGHAMVNSWGANSAPNNVSLFAQTIGSNIYLVTPEISGDMSTINLSFMGKSGQTNLGWPSNMVLEIGTMTDPTDASTFTYFTNIQTQDIYELHNVSFTTYPGTDRYIAFRVSSNIQEQNGYVFIDDVNITSNTIPFCDAVDNCDLSYTFGGNANWFSQSDYTYDGADAVQSGDINDVIGNNEQSWFETTVQGPGIISFWWKVSSEQNYDFLRFYINSEQQNQISGQVDWQYMEYVLLNGENTVRWTYTKDDGLSHYEDCGWVDNVVFTPLTCGSVSGLFADNITINSANLNWTENGTAASWNIQWGEAGFALGEGTIVTGHTSQSLALSGLTPGTLYDFYVQADCGEGDLSLWSSVGSFATECLPFSIPFAENFDNSGSIPVCWNTHNINDGNVVVFGNYSNSAPNMVYLYAWNNTSVATLVTPEIGEDIATLQLSFMAKNYRDNNMILEIGTMSDPTNAGTFSYYTQIQTSANYQLFTIPFNVYAGTDRYIAFRVSSSIQEQTGYVFIDDVSIDVAPSCPAPYNLITNAVTQTTAEVSWTEPGTSTQWDIFYGPAGFDPQTEGTLIEGITTKPYTIEGLNHSTNYEFYVRTYCDETPSGWSAAGSFTTECGAISIPYTENFDNSNSLPLCWNKYEIDGGYVLVYGDLSNSAPNMVYLYASSITSIATLVTPEIGENIAALQLSFMAKNYNDNNMILEIGTMSDPTNAGTFSYYTQIQTSANYQLFTIPFNVYAGTDRYIAFRVSSNIQEQTGYVFIDDVSIDVAPSCPAPYNLITNTVTQTTAEVSWTEPGTSTQWDIIYGPAGFDVNTEGTILTSVTSNPFILTDLNHSTNYEFYVRTYCNETPSGWSAAGSFTTECGPIELSFINPLENQTYDFSISNQIPYTIDYKGCEEIIPSVMIVDESENYVRWINGLYFNSSTIGSYMYDAPIAMPSGTYRLRMDYWDNEQMNYVYSNYFYIENNNAGIEIWEPFSYSYWVKEDGKQYSIVWMSNNVASVNLSYSIDNGNIWNTIENGVSSLNGMNNYLFEIPSSIDGHFTECIIKIEDASNINNIDYSDVFTITSIPPVSFIEPTDESIIEIPGNINIVFDNFSSSWIEFYIEDNYSNNTLITGNNYEAGQASFYYSTNGLIIGETYRIKAHHYNTDYWSHSEYFTVNKATPIITEWPTASGIIYGDALSASVLTGGYAEQNSTQVEGAFTFDSPTYEPGAGTYIANITFTPTDNETYNTVSGTVEVIVAKEEVVVSEWPIASAIIYGNAISQSVLTGGAADVAGEFTFNSPATKPNAGTYAADVTFTPTDNANYNTVMGNVDITVNTAPLTIIANSFSKQAGTDYVFADDEFTTNPAELVGSDAVNSVTLTSDGAINTATVGDYTITPSEASGIGLNNYTITYQNGVLTVTDKTILTISGLTVNSKEYDGTTDATISDWGTLIGVETGHDVSLNTATATVLFDNKNAGNGKTVTLSNLELTGTDAGSYVINDQYASADIYTKALVVEANSESKTYGQADPEFTALFNGFISGENESVLDGELSVTRASGEDVDTYTITPAGLSSNNYSITFQTGLFTINAKELIITANDAEKIYGSNDPALDVSYSGFEFADDEAVLLGELAISRETGEDVNTYSITPSGLSASNYSLSYVNGTFTITPKALTITAENKTKVYGSEDPTFSVVYSGFVTGEDETALSGSLAIDRIAGEMVSTYTITPSGYSSTNYNISYVDGILSINKKGLTVTAENKEKVYGTADPSFTVAYSGFAFDDDATDLSGALNINRTAGEGVNSYAITPSGLSSDNYNISFVNGTLTILPKDLTISAVSTSKVYGDTDPDFTASYNGFITGDDESVLTGTIEFNRADGEDVGDYAITPQGVTANNYTITFANTGILSITPKTLSVTANNAEKIYGSADPDFSVSYNGFAFADNEDDLTGTLSFNRTNGEDVGNYTITASGLSSTNYTISYTTGSLSITPKLLTITANNASKVYGALDPAFTVSYDGFITGEDETVLNGTLGTNRESGETVANYVITPSGLSSTNYTISYATGLLSITAKELTIGGSFTTSNREYDGTNAATISANSLTLEGVITSDEVTLSPVVAFDNKNVGTSKIVSLTNTTTLTGTDAVNYTLSLTGAPTAAANITAKELTVTGATAASKVYDGTTNAIISGATLSGVIGSDVVTMGNATTGTFTQKSVGTGVAVTTAMTISGTDAGNYTVTQPSGLQANITTKELTIGGSFTAQDKEYDGNTTATINVNNLTLTGPISGDEISLTGIMIAFANADIGNDKTVSITAASLDGADKNNYTLSLEGSPTTTASITVSPSTTFTVTYSVVGGNGSLAASVDGSPITSGDEILATKDVIFTATPASGYQVKAWTTNGSPVTDNTTNSLTVANLIANTTVTVEFEAIPPVIYTLTLEVSPLNAGTVTGAGEYEEDEQVTITATPAEGYFFQSWKYNDVVISSDASITYTMPNENVTLVAHFVEETVETFMLTLIANPSNGGTVAGGGQFSQGEVITIAASPAEGFVFVGWTGNVAESMEAITSFTMPAEDATLTANFEVEQPEKYNVTFLVADNGGNSVENASVNITGVSETFTTNNQGIATAQLENGQYDYNITANNFEVSSGNFTVNGADINVDVTLTSVGLEDDILSNIEVYPNPFSNSISLKNADKANRVVITNLIGQVLLDVKLNGSERETIKVEGLAVGVYLMNIYSENGDKVVYKMIKE